MLKSLRSGLRRFARNRRGSIAILFGLAVIPIVLGIGVAVDYGRALLVRERMSSAADAAALAIGSWTGLTDAERRTKAQQYFDANYPSAALGTVGTLNVTFPGDDIKVEVSGTVPTTFMRLANINSVNVGSSAIITVKQRKIELALVLDTTGSMGSGGKMTSLKNAAEEMVKTLFDGNAISPDVKIAVVPFSGAVNIGTDKLNSGWLDKGKYPNMSVIAKEDLDFDSGQSALTLYDDLKKEKSSWAWSGCVRERDDPYELTDDAPVSSATLFAPYLAPDEPDDKGYANSYIDDDKCGESGGKGGKGRGGKPGPAACQLYTGKYENPKADASSAKGPDWNCPPNPVTALTDEKSTVTSAINALTPDGYTVIPAGLLWGWRVLSPGEPFTDGAPYNSDEWIKAIVLLSDGENRVNGGSNGHNESYYNAFGYAAEGHLGSTSGNGAENELDAKTAAVCSAIKAQGIQVYTIGFQITDQTTKNMLKACATEPDMAYLSPTNAQLAGIFNSIAQGLSDLRIAQ